MKILKTNEVVDYEKMYLDKDALRICKKYNSLVRFLSSHKDVILERGCLNGLIEGISLYVEDDSMYGGDYGIIIRDGTFNCNIYFEDIGKIKYLTIDRKYKSIVS